MPKSRGRHGKRERRARQTQAAQKAATQHKKLTLAQYRLRRTAGWSLVAVALFVGTFHWTTHLGMWNIAAQGAQDLYFGYPLAAVLGVAGAMVLSKA